MTKLLETLVAAQSQFIASSSAAEPLTLVLADCARVVAANAGVICALDGAAPVTLASLDASKTVELEALAGTPGSAAGSVVLACVDAEVMAATLVLSGGRVDEAPALLAPALPVIARLITARHRDEQRRKEITNAVAAVVDGGFEWNIVTGDITYSPRFLEMLGLEAPGPRIEAWAGLVHPEDLARQNAAIEAHYFGRAELYQAEYRCRHARTGEWVWLEVRGRIVERRPDGTPVKLYGTHSNITARKALDLRFARTDRLASLGTMAAGMAHEINNPLAFMQSNVEFVRRALQEGSLTPALSAELDLSLKETLEGTARIGRIVRDLRVFSTVSREERKPLQVRAVVAAAQRLIGALLVDRASLVVDVPEGATVLGDENELVQVLVNLLVNAAHALRSAPRTQHEVRVVAREVEGLVELEVCDTGPGVAPEHLRQVFDPFFTTKPIGEGTGLGLAICHSLVTAHGGDIALNNREGGGCRVLVRLPAAKWRSMETPVPQAVAPQHLPRVRVLVVDDEPLMRSALARGLSTDHDVALAADGAEALKMILRDPQWEVVLCDVMMAGLNGLELLDAVRAKLPAMAERIVFVTGGAWDPELRARLEALPNERLEKPVSLLALREVIRRRSQVA